MSAVYIENYQGKNNVPENYRKWEERNVYRNCNTVWITPTRGTCGTRVAFSWMNVMSAPNSVLAKMCVEGLEVGKAYNEAISQVLGNPQLSKFPYILTVEEDNTPPADGALLLFESIAEYDAVGGLYWIKGEGGSPMIWGDPKEPYTYVPQVPKKDAVQQCNGLGMGFTLFRTEMFRNPGFEYGKWFQTLGDGKTLMTQDLYFFKRAAELGYKFACDTRCKVGHYEATTGTIW
jgi:hypothetical protein